MGKAMKRKRLARLDKRTNLLQTARLLRPRRFAFISLSVLMSSLPLLVAKVISFYLQATFSVAELFQPIPTLSETIAAGRNALFIHKLRFIFFSSMSLPLIAWVISLHLFVCL